MSPASRMRQPARCTATQPASTGCSCTGSMRTWNGTDLAEAGDAFCQATLTCAFPPPTSRLRRARSILANRLRLIRSADYTPSPLRPALCPTDGAPWTSATPALRSVSPVHLEYMRNMGTAASMSVSIVIGNRLWGSFPAPRHACHTFCRGARRLRLHPAASCPADRCARTRAGGQNERLRLYRIETELVAHLARSGNLQTGLAESGAQWLALVKCGRRRRDHGGQRLHRRRYTGTGIILTWRTG